MRRTYEEVIAIIDGKEHETSVLYTECVRQICKGGMYKTSIGTKRKQTTSLPVGGLGRLLGWE